MRSGQHTRHKLQKQGFSNTENQTEWKKPVGNNVHIPIAIGTVHYEFLLLLNHKTKPHQAKAWQAETFLIIASKSHLPNAGRHEHVGFNK